VASTRLTSAAFNRGASVPLPQRSALDGLPVPRSHLYPHPRASLPIECLLVGAVHQTMEFMHAVTWPPNVPPESNRPPCWAHLVHRRNVPPAE
jgi:hypothetical protein